MATVVLDREIYSPLARVWEYHCDLERAPEYWTNLRECRRVDTSAGTERGWAPAREGSRYAWRYTMFGRELGGELTVVEYEPGERFAFAIGGAIRGLIRHTYRATARTRTYVVVSVEYELPHGFVGKAIDRLLVEERNAADGVAALDRLQHHLETETAGGRMAAAGRGLSAAPVVDASMAVGGRPAWRVRVSTAPDAAIREAV